MLNRIADGGEDLALSGDDSWSGVEGIIDASEGQGGDDFFRTDGENHAFEEGDIGDHEDGDVVAFFKLEIAQGFF